MDSPGAALRGQQKPSIEAILFASPETLHLGRAEPRGGRLALPSGTRAALFSSYLRHKKSGPISGATIKRQGREGKSGKAMQGLTPKIGMIKREKSNAMEED